jgi:hypothetical protein
MVLVYTDILNGTYADNGDPDPRGAGNPPGTRGDLPDLIASWTGTIRGAGGSIRQRFDDKVAVGNAIGFNPAGGTPWPGKGMIAKGVAAVTAVVKKRTGYTLTPRSPPPPSYDTGFDITR